jgi:uncharacterized membrane protein
MNPEKKSHLISWLVVGLVAIALFCIIFFAIYRSYSLYGWVNSLTITGVIVLASSLLYAVAKAGTFDIFVYGFSDVFFHMNPSPNKVKKYKDYPDYVTVKTEERKKHKFYFWPYVVISGALFIAAIILRILLAVQSGA